MAVENLNIKFYRVDFFDTEACAGCNPISCCIENINIPFVGNWRDLLIAIIEYCILKFPDKIEKLKSDGFSNYSEAPFLHSEKPILAAKKLSTGYWIKVCHGIPHLVRIIAGVCRYCGINLNDINIMYSPKSNDKFKYRIKQDNLYLSPQNSDMANSLASAFSVIAVLKEYYPNGFTFDTTAVRLLSDKSDIAIDENVQSTLKRIMFRRKDNIYFLLDAITAPGLKKEITDVADSWLDDYGCFEISELYSVFINNVNEKAIRNIDDFEAFYEFIKGRDVRCVGYYGTKIARINKSMNDLSAEIAAKIIAIIHDENGGTLNEEELRRRFPAFSLELLATIIKEHAEELVKTEINGIICYQTLDALGLSDEFSETLYGVLEQIDNLGLPPSEEVLHTALSISLGVNFKLEYNIPDDRTYRRLIDKYYKNTPKRKWLRGIFAEEHN